MLIRANEQTVASALSAVNNDYGELDRKFQYGHLPLVDARHMSGDNDAAATVARAREHEATTRQLLFTTDLDLSWSIVIPVRGGAHLLSECLLSIDRQELVRAKPAQTEIIIVEDGVVAGQQSVFDDAAVNEACTRLTSRGARVRRLRVAENIRRALARNVGIDYSAHDVLFFIDGSMVLDSAFLTEHMLRHDRLPRSMALLGFKENLAFSDFNSDREQIVAGSRRADFSRDLKWDHALKPDEAPFDYHGRTFIVGERINYMELTGWLHQLDANTQLGNRTLSTFFQTNIVSVPREAVTQVGGFSGKFQLWGFEDSFLGALLLARNLRLVPCPSGVAFNLEDPREDNPHKLHDIENNRQLYRELLGLPLKQFSKSRFREQIDEIKHLVRELDPLAREAAYDHRSAPSALRRQVNARTEMTRFALEPQVLPRIPRRGAAERIERLCSSLAQPKIFFIVGEAGCGKSTMLGAVSQALIGRAGWLGLILCSDLAADYDSKEALSAAFGDAIGAGTPLHEAVRTLIEQGETGVLLVDTLDLVLSAEVVPQFHNLLADVVDAGATVVVTCRQEEYAAFFEPTSTKLARLATRLDCWQLGDFDDDEMRVASQAYAASRDPRADGASFASALTELEADETSLKLITRKPILLSLLCELFSESGEHVPRDLTVSELYKSYWKMRVEETRTHGRDSAVSIAKEGLCMRFAQLAADVGSGQLREWIGRTDLVTQPQTDTEALEDLLSGGVLVRAPHGRLRFFHQTLLEYAVARWWSTAENQARLKLILEGQHSPLAQRVVRFWPILRQLMSIVDDGQYNAIVQSLPVSELAAFRAVSFAAGTRSGSTALLELLPLALHYGEQHQRTLLTCADGAFREQQRGAFEIAATVLERGADGLGSQAAITMGKLLRRRSLLNVARVERCLSAIASRRAGAKPQPEVLVGAVLAELRNTLLDPDCLRVLRGSTTSARARVVQLHLLPGVAQAAKQAMLDTLLASEQIDKETMESAAQLAAEVTFPQARAEGPRWEEAETFLHADSPRAVRLLRSKAIGLVGARVGTKILGPLVEKLLRGEGQGIQQNLTALIEACKQGAADKVACALADTSPETTAHGSKALLGLFKVLGPLLHRGQQVELQTWVGRLENADPELEALLSPPGAKPQTSVPDLLDRARGQSRTTALQASRQLLELSKTAASSPTVEASLSLLGSKFTGVRENSIRILSNLSETASVTEQQMIQCWTLLVNEREPAVLRPMLDLVRFWVRASRRIPPPIETWVAHLIPRLSESGEVESGVARAALIALKSVAQACGQTAGNLGVAIHALFRCIDVRSLSDGESEAIDLLAAGRPHDPGLFERLIDDGATLPANNMHAVAKAIKRCEGASSPLLDRIAKTNPPPGYETWLLEVRGA